MNPTSETRHAVSSGGVLFRRGSGGHEVALTLRNQGKVWCLPKGLVETGETHEQAALREVREETGYEARLMGSLGAIDYWFYWAPEKVRYHKVVHFFLLEETGGSSEDHDFEVEAVEWFPIEDALTRLTYPKEHEVVERALEELSRLE